MSEALSTESMTVNAEIRDKTKVLIILAAIAMIGCFYLFTIRAGHEWGDDFSHYILHAKSIAEGRSYSDTGYIVNPLYSKISPKVTYPVLPVVLAPVYKAFGLNVTALKMVVLPFFLGLLFVLFRTYRDRLPFPYVLALVVFIGLSPLFWEFKDYILSDLPFLFFIYATLYAIQRYHDASHRHWSFNLAYAVLVGFLIYVCYGTRPIGGLLIPVLIAYDVLSRKRLSRFAITTSVIAGSLIIVQGVALPTVGNSYIGWIYEHMREDVSQLVWSNLLLYAFGLSVPWENGYSRVIKYGISIVMIILAAVGFRKRIADGVMIHEVFFICYVLILLIIPGHELRYLFPIIPLYVLYGLIGAKQISSSVSLRSLRYVPIFVAIVVVLSYAAKFTKVNYGPIPEGVGRVESQELFRYIKEHTEPTDIVVFRKPRALALFTGRRVSIYPEPTDNPSSWDQTAWDYFHDIDARYLVVAVPRHAQGLKELREIEWVRQFVERCRDRCKEVFANADFGVYELRYPPGQDSVPRPVLTQLEAK